jgi:NDP-sugar pyrophosphorylase family protein
MILAAGVGSRLDPLTSETPKPLVPVANEPVMEHILNLLSKHGLKEACANLHYLPEKIEQYFADANHTHLSLQLMREEKLSGDAGGVRACRKFLQDDTCIVISGDLLTDANLTRIIEEHKKKGALASIALKQVDDVTRFGVALLDKNGLITGFQEKPAAAEALSNLISTGIYVLEPKVFDYIPSQGEYGFGRQLFPSLVKQGLPIMGVEIDDYWSDVGTIDQYRQANFDALTGKVNLIPPARQVRTSPYFLWLAAGAAVEADESLSGNLLLGNNSVVKKGAQIRGTVVIGDNCTIQPGALVTNSVIWAGSNIGEEAEIDSCVLGSNCLVEAKRKLHAVASTAQSLTEEQMAQKK